MGLSRGKLRCGAVKLVLDDVAGHRKPQVAHVARLHNERHAALPRRECLVAQPAKGQKPMRRLIGHGPNQISG